MTAGSASSVGGAGAQGIIVVTYVPVNPVSGDTQSSGSLVYLLRNLAANSTISVATVNSGATGAVTEDTPALLTLWHKSAQSNWIQDTEWWYQNTNAQTPTTPWAGLTTPGDMITTGDPIVSGNAVRIRMSLMANVNTIAGADSFNLQYAPGSICSLALAWTNIGAPGSGSIWRGNNNTSVMKSLDQYQLAQ